MTKIAVAALSFARNAKLRAEISARYPDVSFPETRVVLDGDALIDFLRGHDAAIVGLERIDGRVLDAVPELRTISKYGVGFDGIDVDAIRSRGVRLAWTGGLNRCSVAELTLCFAIALTHRVPEMETALRRGQWSKVVGVQLTGRTVGIVGCGFVGKYLVGLLQPFKCRVLAHDIRNYDDFYRTHDVQAVSLTELLDRSDLVTLHVPLDESTRGMIGAAQIARMRKGAFLINAARGGLVDENALADALESGHLAGAAADVFAHEPDANPRLTALPTFLGTPHAGAATEEAQWAMGRAAIEGLETAGVPGPNWPE
jgi:D-3-phosphoglycerate dehydrogenase